MDFGILSAGDNPYTGNKPVTGHNELIHNSVTFTLNGFSELVDADDVCNVRFQYGTSLSEPSFLGNRVAGGGGGGGKFPNRARPHCSPSALPR